MKQSQQILQNEKMEKLIVTIPESKHETVDFMLYVTTFLSYMIFICTKIMFYVSFCSSADSFSNIYF